jgi:hypothetical protein
MESFCLKDDSQGICVRVRIFCFFDSFTRNLMGCYFDLFMASLYVLIVVMRINLCSDRYMRYQKTTSRTREGLDILIGIIRCLLPQKLAAMYSSHAGGLGMSL